MGAVLIFLGDSVFTYLQVPAPNFYQYMKNNKIITGLLLWMVGNYIINVASSTGAFEVFYKGEMVFSKLESGRFPRAIDILVTIGKEPVQRQVLTLQDTQ